MTMLLTSVVAVPVQPVEGKPGWFAFAGRPQRSLCEDLHEWTGNYDNDAVVRKAKIVGLHDDDEILADDVRFNYRAEGDEIAVVRDPAEPGGYLMALLVNRPEALLFEFIFDLQGQGGASDFPYYKPGAREAEEAHWQKYVVGEQAKVKAAKAVPKKPAAKPKAKPKAGAGA